MTPQAIYALLAILTAITFINAGSVWKWLKTANDALIEHPHNYIMACLGILSAICLMFWWISGGDL